MMTKEQYNAQRTKLLNDMRAAIDAGDIETSNRCRDEINQLDADYEAAAQARANLAALENGNRSYNLPDVTPAQTKVTRLSNRPSSCIAKAISGTVAMMPNGFRKAMKALQTV